MHFCDEYLWAACWRIFVGSSSLRLCPLHQSRHFWQEGKHAASPEIWIHWVERKAHSLMSKRGDRARDDTSVKQPTLWLMMLYSPFVCVYYRTSWEDSQVLSFIIVTARLSLFLHRSHCSKRLDVLLAQRHWQKLHSHAYTRAMVCSFVSFTYYLIYLRRQIAKKIHLWHCLLHRSFPSHSW
jgi:hypothetical protein